MYLIAPSQTLMKPFYEPKEAFPLSAQRPPSEQICDVRCPPNTSFTLSPGLLVLIRYSACENNFCGAIISFATFEQYRSMRGGEGKSQPPASRCLFESVQKQRYFGNSCFISRPCLFLTISRSDGFGDTAQGS